MLQRFQTGIRNAAHDAFDYAADTLNETTIRLAVTGLSRAGKTVFITSLIANLLALGRGKATLPGLQALLTQPTGQSRLLGVRLLPPGSGETPMFDHARNLATLAAASPNWPPRTDDLTEVALELLLERQGLRARLGPRRIRLEILDYPGEWLLDLPLLNQSFSAWSRETLARVNEEPRRTGCAAFLEQLPVIDSASPPDHGAIRSLHTLYRDGLEACRTQFGLRLLQPGRFLCPGPRADAPFMWFFPLHDAPEHPTRGTTAALLDERFEAYKADMRARFFEASFAHFDRQVLLVDVLGSLQTGRDAFLDTENALTLIAAGLSYGRNGLSRSMHAIGSALRLTAASRSGGKDAAPRLMGRSIERVAFVATKADHVPALRRANLRHLLQDIVGHTREQVGTGPVSFHTAAAVLSTVDASILRDGLVREMVRGTLLGDGAAKLFDPGDVPSSRPPDTFWEDHRFTLPVFEPPAIKPPDGSNGIPHLGLDDVLASVLEGALS